MSDLSYSSMLRELSKDYFQNHIDFAEYRERRKVILDDIEAEVNGRSQQELIEQSGHDSSIFMKTIAFFKNSDVDK